MPLQKTHRVECGGTQRGDPPSKAAVVARSQNPSIKRLCILATFTLAVQ